MNQKQLRELIEQGESQYLDFKKTPANIGKDICGFANTNDGIILVGVADNGKPIGVSNKDEEQVANSAYSLDKPVYPEIIKINSDGKTVLMVKVKKSSELHTYKGYGYKRVGSTDKPMSIEELVKKAQELGIVKFDSGVCKNAALTDIDEEKVKWFLRKAKYERNFDVNPDTPVGEALERLDLIKNRQLTNAAILLFGKKPQEFFLQAKTRCARFKGTEPLEFIDMKVFAGNIINQRDDAVEFVKEHIKLHAKIVGTERVEKWEYPIEAVREAITNAICHKDYEISSNVQIRIFDDRIEIWGCGSLPEPLTTDDLKKNHRSILRNSLIGECLFLIRYIEEWGTGTNRIIKECLKSGLPEPLFEMVTKTLVVTFKKYKITNEILSGLNERQQKGIKYLIKHEKITNKEYRQINSNVTDRTVLNDFNELIDKKIITARGEKKSRYYVLR